MTKAEAYCQLIPGTVPDEAGFRQRLVGTPTQQVDAWLKEFERLHRAMRRFLEAKGVPRWDAAGRARLLDHLREKHDWLDEQAGRRLVGFAGWYAWHEGLTKFVDE